MTATPEPRDFQTEVFDRLDRLEQTLDSRIQGLEQKLDADIQRLDERTDKWEERFLQLSKDNLTISRTVIIAAATVVIFGSLLDKAEVLVEGAARLFGK
jgi:F0F1-type ATP synthase assembly protein I